MDKWNANWEESGVRVRLEVADSCKGFERMDNEGVSESDEVHARNRKRCGRRRARSGCRRGKKGERKFFQVVVEKAAQNVNGLELDKKVEVE